MKILLVDDQSIMRAFIRRQLEDLGHEFVEAANVQQAIDTLKADFSIKLVFCDFVMNGQTALEFLDLKQGIAFHQNTPVVIVSATRGKEDIAASKRRGVLAWLFKPFTREDLTKVLAMLA